MQKTWKKRLDDLLFNLNDLQVPVYAASACYFLAIAVFPALLLILASLRYTPLSATNLIRLLEGILPSALMGAVESLIVSTYTIPPQACWVSPRWRRCGRPAGGSTA